MTERERWIVYPLLFLALGAALRDKLFDSTTTKSIVCQELTVVDEEPRRAMRPSARRSAQIGRTDSAHRAGDRRLMGYAASSNGQVDSATAPVRSTPAVRLCDGVPFAPTLHASRHSARPSCWQRFAAAAIRQKHPPSSKRRRRSQPPDDEPTERQRASDRARSRQPAPQRTSRPPSAAAGRRHAEIGRMHVGSVSPTSCVTTSCQRRSSDAIRGSASRPGLPGGRASSSGWSSD